MDKEIEFGNYFYFIIREGTTIFIQNPDWDGDKPETHFYYDLDLKKDVMVCTDSGTHIGKVINKYPCAFTDYPFIELGDIPQKQAPIREVILLSYDQEKYVTVKYRNIIKEIKSGYLYSKEGRLGEVPKIDNEIILNLPLTHDEKEDKSE